MKNSFEEYFVEVATAKEREEMKKGNHFAGYFGASKKPTPEQKEQIKKDKVQIAKKEKATKKAKEAEAKAIKDEMTKRNKERNSKIDSIKIDTDVLKQEVANLMMEDDLEFEDACDEIINSYRNDLNRKQLEPEIENIMKRLSIIFSMLKGMKYKRISLK